MTVEYLDRSSLVARMKYYENHTAEESGEHYAYAVALREIRNAPAADVAEVVHGRWIDGAEDFTCGNHNAECSICRCYVSWGGCDEDFNYCPNCGAKMDGGNDDG